MTVQTISPQELQRQRQQGKVVELIDVRTPVEYAEIHVAGARLMPLDSLDARTLASERNGEPLYVICRSGGRAAKAYEKLQAEGVNNLEPIRLLKST